MKTTLLFLSVFLSVSIFGQAPAIEWEKTFGGGDNEWAHKMIMCSDGGLIIGGASQSPSIVGGGPCDSKSLLLKIDSLGNLLWQKTFGTCSGSWVTDMIELDGDSAILAVTGTTSDGMDAYVNVYDVNSGILKGNISFGNGCCENAYPTRLIKESDSVFYVVGLTNEYSGEFTTNQGLNDGWVSKLKLSYIPSAPGMPGIYDLQKEWIKMFGGLENDRFVSGNFHNNTLNIIGITNQQSFGTALETPWFLKIDTSGNVVYEDTTANFTHIENVSNFNNDGSAHIIHSGTGPDCHVRINQLNDNGQIVASDTILINDDDENFYSQYDAANLYGEHERSQLILVNGYYYLTRTTDDCSNAEGDIGVTKLNSNFDVLYDYTIGGSSDDFAGSIIYNSNSIYVCGTTESNDGDIAVNNGMKDIWVVKLSDGTSNLTELTSSKTLIQILDLMGRETTFKPNTPLIYVYDDGSTEKVFSVEY